ncbi:hypothetical protein IID23_04640 [Patescibacteria group bacterium]|nr:hypothetical protein [Patescibacteria group bacterium]
MNLPKKHLPKYYISLIAIIFILAAIPFTVFSVFQTRPSTPQAATCFDLNGDGIVDQKDIDLVVEHFGFVKGDSTYDPRYDFDGSGNINTLDIGIIISHTGETCPPTASFSASKTSINKGQSVTLSWSTTRASSVSITNIGSVSKSGSKVVSPSSTKTYKLTASGPGGTKNKSITISVSTPGTTSTTTTTFPPPKDSNSVTLLTLSLNQVKQLGGQLKLSISISGTKFSKGVTITKNTKKIDLKIPEGKVKKNKTYSLVIKGAKLLTKKVKFKASDFKKTVKIGDLFLGDINSNNIVNQEDLNIYLNNLFSIDVDANFDEVVNSLDYSIILTNIGKK